MDTKNRELDCELLNAAADAWKGGSGETDAWSRAALRSLLDGSATPESVANSVYAIMRPFDTRGSLTSPKLRNGKLIVRSLENATNPVPGAAAARKNLETVLKLFDNRKLIASELEAFAHGDKTWKLYGLAALLRRR